MKEPGTTDEPMLVCRDLEYSYGDRRAVDHLSFEVHRGEAYGLLGPNGAGKTTVIKIVCGILRAQSGTVTIDGSPIGGRDRAPLAALGYVPQEIALYPMLTLEENLSYWCRVHGLRAADRKRRIDELLDLVGLSDRRNDRLEHCSGGMQRRLNIAAGMVHDPQLLVLDEPTVGVDAQSRASMLTTIRALRDLGLAVLYTSHYFDEVERLCDRVGIQDGGRLLIEGSPGELLESGGPAVSDLEGLFLELTGSDLRD